MRVAKASGLSRDAVVVTGAAEWERDKGDWGCMASDFLFC
jgi:hypothetical protein